MLCLDNSFAITNKPIQTRASISHIVINDGLSFLGSTAQQVSPDFSLADKNHLSHRFTLGCAIVTLDEACLFADGRYFLQAEKQLDKLQSRSILFASFFLFTFNDNAGTGS